MQHTSGLPLMQTIDQEYVQYAPMVSIKGRPYWLLRPTLTITAALKAVRGVGVKKKCRQSVLWSIAQRTESRDVMFYCVRTQPPKNAAV